MAYKPLRIPQSADEPVYEWRLSQINGGVCYEDLEFKLNDNQSPRMLNAWFMDRALSKRWGQEWVLAAPISANPILAVYERKYKEKVVFAHNTSLYTLDLSAKTTTEIKTGLTAAKGSFFLFNGILYYLNGHEYIQWDGTTAAAVVGYIPTVLVNSPPAGGGTTYEAYNYLSPGFTVLFSGTADATEYQLPQSGLDATTVTCEVYTGGSWVTKTEGTDFTVNRTTGAVTFTAAPGAGTNNVKITAYKTIAGEAEYILNCMIGIDFGGESSGLTGGTRLFVGANPNYKNQVWYSGLLDPTYFPYPNFSLIGANDEIITAFGKQYNILAVFKAHSVTGIRYQADSSASAGFKLIVSTINGSVGCDMPYTVRLINNRLTWANTYSGVNTLVSTDVQDERNVQPISRNINGNGARPGFLSESISDLQAATAMDFKGKYWLCIGKNVYMWDYSVAPYVYTGDTDADARRLAWFLLDNINANCWFNDGVELYYGDRTTGNFIHFIKSFFDFGGEINAYYRMPLRDFGKPDWLKTVTEMRLTCRADTYTQINVKYITERDETVEPSPIEINTFKWNNTSFWATFTWNVLRFAKTIFKRPNKKKVVYFGAEFSNNEAGRDLSIMDIVLKYRLDKEVR